MKQTLPRQIPKGVDLPELIHDTHVHCDGLTGIIFVQIAIQVFAKGNMAEILSAFYAIQYCCFFTFYTTGIPSNTEIYMDEFRNLISFSALNPESILDSMAIDFTIAEMLGLADNERMSSAAHSC